MKHTLIIAEAGVNHNGSLAMAKQLVDAAAEAEADYIKFQTFKTENLVSKSAKQAEYQKRNIGSESEDSQYQMLKRLELSEASHEELIRYCKEKKIKFLSTAFDLDSIDYLASLDLGLWKIPSGEITNFPYIREIAQKHQPVILSTGMCTDDDIQNAVRVLLQYGVKKEQISILHCNTEYPTPMEDVNLSAMLTIKSQYGVAVGYSDHTQGVEVPIAAVALGATIVEKHFTLDRTLPGPDHIVSLEPCELKAMVKSIRNIEKAIGDGVKRVSASEAKNIAVARKSIVAAVPIKKGEILSEENLSVKRPGTGLSPMLWETVVGTRAICDYQAEDLIQLS